MIWAHPTRETATWPRCGVCTARARPGAWANQAGSGRLVGCQGQPTCYPPAIQLPLIAFGLRHTLSHSLACIGTLHVSFDRPQVGRLLANPTKLSRVLGMDVTGLMSVPLFICEPFSMLQKMAEIMEYTDLLDAADAAEDPYERCVHPGGASSVCCWRPVRAEYAMAATWLRPPISTNTVTPVCCVVQYCPCCCFPGVAIWRC